MANAKKYPVELTMAELVELRDEFVTRHQAQAYYAKQRLDEIDEGDSWKANSITGARAEQARYSHLHEILFGAGIDPTPEEAPTPKPEEDAADDA